MATLVVGAPFEPMMLACFDGYIDPAADSRMTSSTKIGGLPTFCAAAVGAAEALAPCCRRCKAPLRLLAQCFCPLVDTGFNRMMYIFACNKGACSSFGSESWAAFTVQVDAEDDEALAATDDEVTVLPSAVPATDEYFPPATLYVVEEPVKEDVVLTEHELEIKRKMEASPAVTADDDERRQLEEIDQEIDLRNKATDVNFEKFRRRIARQQDQVLRYQHNGAPVFMNVENTIYATIPPCKHCGGPMCMELQVMPTVVYYLKLEALAPGATLDFGTATVYTCAASCRAKVAGLLVNEEFVFVEPAPTIESERAAAEGKSSLREVVTGAPS